MNNNIQRKIVSTAKKILEKINSNDDIILIFGLSSCKYCKNSLEFVKNNNLQFKYYDMDKYYEIFIPILNKLSELNDKLCINPNHRTFPVIFYNKKFLGGYTELIQNNNV
jgi:glutaredoxin